MSSDYPPGAQHDPDAPWNEKDYGSKTCPDCYGTGEEPDALILGKSIPICKTCEGTGEVSMDEDDFFDEQQNALEELAEERRQDN